MEKHFQVYVLMQILDITTHCRFFLQIFLLRQIIFYFSFRLHFPNGVCTWGIALILIQVLNNNKKNKTYNG